MQKINILRYLDGAEKARGIAVIIDVFRAFSFECYLVRANIERIIPVASKELAYELKRQNPSFLLAGERRGITLPGFDFGNSPAQAENADLSGKTLVHTTSAGTQGLEKAADSGQVTEILAASLVNAKATAGYILRGNYNEVSLVCMGEDAVRLAGEDELCARYIRDLLLGLKPDLSRELDELRNTDGQKFFDPSNDIFPERDFHLCTAVDEFGFALKYTRGENGLGCITPVIQENL